MEDEASTADLIAEALRPDTVTVVAGSRDAAFAVLDTPFDYIICDLRIPTQDGALDAAVEHGEAVLTRVLSALSGTPAIVLSAYGTVDLVNRLLPRTRQDDPFGVRQPMPMLRSLKKSELPECIDLLRAAAVTVGVLNQIEISTGAFDIDLQATDRRVLQVFARRVGGGSARISALGGGLSGSHIFRVEVHEANGALCSSVAAKFGVINDIREEKDRFDTFVGPHLPPGAFTPLVDTVQAGAGNHGGIFYTLAQGDSVTLFEWLRLHPDTAIDVVRRLRNKLRAWRQGVPVDRVSVQDIRSRLLTDEEFGDIGAQLAGLPWADAEERFVNARLCREHGDLHGLNVLVTPEGDPLVIDFLSVRRAGACLDPLTLELSLLCHPQGRALANGWPHVDQVASWRHLDEYLEGCPVPDLIRECRAWEFEDAGGDAEVFAHLYAYGARQMRFVDVDPAVARSLTSAGLTLLAAS